MPGAIDCTVPVVVDVDVDVVDVDVDVDVDVGGGRRPAFVLFCQLVFFMAMGPVKRMYRLVRNGWSLLHHSFVPRLPVR